MAQPTDQDVSMEWSPPSMAQLTDQDVSMEWSPTPAPVIFERIPKRRFDDIIDNTTPLAREPVYTPQHQQYVYQEPQFNAYDPIFDAAREPVYRPQYQQYEYEEQQFLSCWILYVTLVVLKEQLY